MQDITFAGEGPLMSGTWYNPVNGDSFTVADSFFQDNQYIVKTTDGRMLDYNFIQHYVKSDSPIPKPQQKLGNININNTLPKEVQDLIAHENVDNGIIEDDLNIVMNKPVIQPQPIQQSNPNSIIIEKALSKKPNPNIDCFVEWEVFPTKEIELLIDVMEVNIEDILEYYANKLDLNTIKESIKKNLESYIAGRLNNDEPISIVTAQVVANTEPLVESVTVAAIVNDRKKSKTKKQTKKQ